jgi:hypothetical protein
MQHADDAVFYTSPFGYQYFYVLGDPRRMNPADIAKGEKLYREMTERDWAKEQICVLSEGGISKSSVLKVSRSNPDNGSSSIILEDCDNIISEMLTEGLIVFREQTASHNGSTSADESIQIAQKGCTDTISEALEKKLVLHPRTASADELGRIVYTEQ